MDFNVNGELTYRRWPLDLALFLMDALCLQ